MTIKSCERNDNSTAKLVIEIDKETFEQNIEKAYRQARGKIFVPGFRKGKAPRKVVEGMYGASVFYEDAINLLFPEAFKEAVESEKLDAIGNPSVTAVDTTDGVLTLTVETDVYPTVTLGQYKGLEVPKAEATLTDAEVDAEIERLRERNARITTVERPAQLGDTVVIDFEGFKDGVPFEGGKGEGHSLKLGSGSFIPGFEDQLVGCSAGEEKTVEVVFPENYGASELAGQPATFQCKVHEVKETVKPALDDEFAKDVSEFENLADFRKSLADRITERRTKQAEADFDNQIMEQLVENMECEIPDGMVDVQLDRMMENYAMELQSQGFSMEDYQKMMGVSGDVIRDSARPSALRQVQMQLALTAVADAENIEISDDELEAEVNRLAEQYKIKPEQVKAAVNDADLIRDLRLRKASDLVIAEAKVGKAKKKAAAKKTEKAEEAEGEEKPKRTRKKKTEETEEPKAE